MEGNKNRVNIGALKLFAVEHLSLGSPLREILLAEKEELGVVEFLVKMEIWLRLCRLSQSRPTPDQCRLYGGVNEELKIKPFIEKGA